LYDPSLEHDSCGVGFVVQIKGLRSHSIVEQGLEMLARLSHRGGGGADPESGDGAGILVQLPHELLGRAVRALGFELPQRGRYAVGQVFLPVEPQARAACERALEEAAVEEGQKVMGWRDVPVETSQLGPMAAEVLPVVRQLFVRRRRVVPSAFERRLFVIRKLAENRIRSEGLDPSGRFHVASFSAQTIVYKGLVLPRRLAAFFTDLQSPRMVSALAMIHSRFSTNTFATWDLAQPMRFVAHNGEINTLQGNRNWCAARRSLLGTARFGGDLDRLFPIIVPGKSDTAQFDNMVELLNLAGRPLPHALMLMIPEAWEEDALMPSEARDFYEFNSSLMEPWDGPAALCFTDGTLIGATLDRNGLRPARYLITRDDRVVLASETGVLEIEPEDVVQKGRLSPGRMLLVDTEEGSILDDDAVKGELSQRWPYRRWLQKNTLTMDQFPHVQAPGRTEITQLGPLQRAFGYTNEDLRAVIRPMAQSGHEPVGSMGRASPLAVLSDQAPNLSNYFHQRFAQVTNPAIDPIRESLVMSLRTAIGPHGNTFNDTPEQCHRLTIPAPILRNGELSKIISMREGLFDAITLPALFELSAEASGLQSALDTLCLAAEEVVDDGYNLICLSDRGVDGAHVPIPILLAVSAVHYHLLKAGTRTQAGLVVETGEARGVHDFAVLLAYGVAAINPWLAMDTIQAEARKGRIAALDGSQTAFQQAVNQGLLKVMSKMGISTLSSFRSAQTFEAVGLDRDLVERYFRGTPSRLGGIDMEGLGREAIQRHQRGFGQQAPPDGDALPTGGRYRWRRAGEPHRWNPRTITGLQEAAWSGDPERYAAYSAATREQAGPGSTLRDRLELVLAAEPAVPLEEVEPAREIVRRFVTGAMSFGSISAEAHETLAIAMNRLGGRSNSGEGGEEPERWQLLPNGDDRRSKIHQVASGRFGVTARFLVNAEDLQIKIAQGAKPGEGGQLPGHKVNERIAKVRCSTPGVTLISPPPHHDIYSIEDLAQLVYDLQAVNPRARVSVKLVSQAGVGTVAAGVAKAGAGAVVIAGHDGGTGASPLSSVQYAGMPWELGVAETQQVLVQNGLRDRIRLQVDGGLRTGHDVVVAALLGAEEFGFATAALITLGCVMQRNCHLDTCSVGIATQGAEQRKRFAGKPEYVVSFLLMLAEEVRGLMARLGFRRFHELVGRVDKLRQRPATGHWKADLLDLSALLASSGQPPPGPQRCATEQRVALDDHFDQQLLAPAQEALERGLPLEVERPVRNIHRAVGSLLSGELARRPGSEALLEGTITVRLTGTAGQSLGAFLVRGVTLELEGDANDYVGKGLSGGRISIRPPSRSQFRADENVIIGNTALYGATAGELFVAGQAGERFAVRNSGAQAVVEGVGDHGCEYMTGGVVVVLGQTGRNFAAGMSGGMAFVFDRDRVFRERCNRDQVELESLVDEEDMGLVHGLLEDHVRCTDSELGRSVLATWQQAVPRFVKIMPREYKRVLQAQRALRVPLRPPPDQWRA